MRWLAIDYGTKRTGLAVTDPSRIIATGLETVETVKLLPYLKAYFEKEPVEQVIIGMPKQNSGEDSNNAQHVRGFIRKFKTMFPALAIQTVDERFSSVLAKQTMLASGIGKSKRADKALVDKISATILLQDFMEAQNLRKPQ